ncbi:MAG: acyl-CoA dehydrogenase family protein [Pseudomonadota bacterium]
MDTNATKPVFTWDDPLRFDDELSDEERAMHEAATRFAQGELAPLILKWHRDETFDRDLYKAYAELGILGGTLAGYDCPGLSHVAYGLVARAFEHVDTAFRSAMGAHSGLAMAAIHNFGDEAQKQRLLPAMVRADLIGCFGLTEANHGSDPSGMETRARTVPGGYALSGNKNWITNAPIADLAVVWARDDDRNIGAFIIERPYGSDVDGLATPRIEGKFGMRASPTGQLMMDEVFVPAENRLPHVRGLGSALACLSRARFVIAWGTMGSAAFCWQAARQYTLDRKQFGRPLAATQLVQRKLADMQTDIALGLQAALRISRLADEGRATPEMFSLVKRNNAGKALDIARVARDMHGGNGIADDYGVIRHVMNMEVVNTLEGTHDIHALVLGRAQTGLNAF